MQKCIGSVLVAGLSTVNFHPASSNILLFLADFLLSQCGIFDGKSEGNIKKKKGRID